MIVQLTLFFLTSNSHILTGTPVGYTRQDMINTKEQKCTSCEEKKTLHPDHSAELSRLHRIQGQVEGIVRMITERRYCPDILTQLKAVQAALKSVEGTILKNHMQDCVKQAMDSKNEIEIKQKVDELVALFIRG